MSPTTRTAEIDLAVVIGGLVGAEREFRTGIGLRTMMMLI